MKPFSQEHVIYLIITISCALFYGLPHILKFSERTRWLMKWSLFWILLVNETWWWWFRSLILGVPFKGNLPLHLCDMAFFITLLAIIFEKKILKELTYFVSVSAGLLAIAYPNLSDEGATPFLSHARYMITHIAILCSGIYFTIGSGFRPTYHSLIRCFFVIHAYGFFVAIPNAFLNTNYFYVCHKPASPSFLPELPLPLYLFAFSGVYVMVLHLLYVPWGLVRSKHR